MRLMSGVVAVVAAVSTLVVGQGQPGWAAAPSNGVKNGDLTYSGFSYGPGDVGAAIFVQAPRSAGPAALWVDPDPDYLLSPKWSADGSEIAYLLVHPNQETWLVIRNATTGTTTRVIPVPVDVVLDSDGMDWSPDGTRFVLSDLRSLYVLNTATGDVRRIFSKPGQLHSPAWSPDGTQIAFVRGSAIKLISPDGTGLRTFTSSAGGLNVLPDWSPDSSKIAFVTDRFGDRELVTLPRSGTGSVTRVSHLAGQPPVRFSITDLAWSPDGKKIAALEFEDLDLGLVWTRIRAYAANGSGKYWLTERLDPDGQTGGLDWGRRAAS
jgi:WD40 repeat protein